MLVNPVALAVNPRSWLVAGTMVALVIATKYAAAWLVGAFYGYSREARGVMFGLSVVQAAATLAAVLVGYQLKVFDATVLDGAVAMILITCPLGAWMVQRHGRGMATEAKPEERPAAAVHRVLVPVVHATFAPRLLDFAFLMYGGARSGAIHPVTIIPDSDDVDVAMARGEKLLAECLTHAAAADVAVEPIVRVDVNPSDGIIRAAKETHANVVVSGWGGKRKASDQLFGSVIERLVEGCPPRLFICHLVRPLNTTRCVRVLAPPLAERRSDLPAVVREATAFSAQIGAGLCVYLSGGDQEPIRRVFEKQRSARPVNFARTENWVEARTRLLADTGPDDLLLALAERRNGLLWTPTMDKLSALLRTRCPDNNLVLAYPALTSFVEEERAEIADPVTDTPGVSGCDLPVGLSLDGALGRLTSAAFPDDPEAAEEALRLLLTSAKGYPVELPAETVLLHAHSSRVARPVLLVGLGRDHWSVPTLNGPVRLLLGLLNPADNPPECHLRTLAELGRRFQNPVFLQALQSATRAEEVVQAISRPLS